MSRPHGFGAIFYGCFLACYISSTELALVIPNVGLIDYRFIEFFLQVYMTIVLLAVPLVIMTVLYGSVIRTLKLGIRLEIAAVDSVDQESKRSGGCVVSITHADKEEKKTRVT